MRRCPSCGYGNPDASCACAICGRDISSVTPYTPPPPHKDTGLAVAAVALGACALMAAAALHFQRAPAPKPAADDAPFDYAGTLYSLDRMSSLRYLSPEEKRKAAAGIYSEDPKAAYAAVKLAGQWSRNAASPEEAGRWFGELVSAASGAVPEAAGQAALEAGLDAASGMDTGPWLAGIRLAVSSMTASGNEDLVSSGFFLASMCGMEDFVPGMEKALSAGGSGRSGLYAACALARLDRQAGYDRLLALASGGDPDLSGEAVACLAYSKVQGTDAFLNRAAAGGDSTLAEGARKSLIFRKQLGIIKK